ncbi:hypothetical protein KSP35_12285 [Aquihabitans sp. G128]|uniref:hypothetical protein n=1 Tax=Aquihabitans sp. G128 TaxID=2849779 RepID=UPI001C22D1BD|nr:hypothetical protein [Aquihabitans sp. G128]QXC59189.1 hypothetical protein KSP35_12285 [Aquihabitans sp. G128]
MATLPGIFCGLVMAWTSASPTLAQPLRNFPTVELPYGPDFGLGASGSGGAMNDASWQALTKVRTADRLRVSATSKRWAALLAACCASS